MRRCCLCGKVVVWNAFFYFNDGSLACFTSSINDDTSELCRRVSIVILLLCYPDIDLIWSSRF
jgi:hypothetical protein